MKIEDLRPLSKIIRPILKNQSRSNLKIGLRTRHGSAGEPKWGQHQDNCERQRKLEYKCPEMDCRKVFMRESTFKEHKHTHRRVGRDSLADKYATKNLPQNKTSRKYSSMPNPNEFSHRKNPKEFHKKSYENHSLDRQNSKDFSYRQSSSRFNKNRESPQKQFSRQKNYVRQRSINAKTQQSYRQWESSRPVNRDHNFNHDKRQKSVHQKESTRSNQRSRSRSWSKESSPAFQAPSFEEYKKMLNNQNLKKKSSSAPGTFTCDSCNQSESDLLSFQKHLRSHRFLEEKLVDKNIVKKCVSETKEDDKCERDTQSDADSMDTREILDLEAEASRIHAGMKSLDKKLLDEHKKNFSDKVAEKENGEIDVFENIKNGFLEEKLVDKNTIKYVSETKEDDKCETDTQSNADSMDTRDILDLEAEASRILEEMKSLDETLLDEHKKNFSDKIAEKENGDIDVSENIKNVSRELDDLEEGEIIDSDDENMESEFQEYESVLDNQKEKNKKMTIQTPLPKKPPKYTNLKKTSRIKIIPYFCEFCKEGKSDFKSFQDHLMSHLEVKKPEMVDLVSEGEEMNEDVYSENEEMDVKEAVKRPEGVHKKNTGDFRITSTENFHQQISSLFCLSLIQAYADEHPSPNEVDVLPPSDAQNVSPTNKSENFSPLNKSENVSPPSDPQNVSLPNKSVNISPPKALNKINSPRNEYSANYSSPVNGSLGEEIRKPLGSGLSLLQTYASPNSSSSPIYAESSSPSMDISSASLLSSSGGLKVEILGMGDKTEIEKEVDDKGETDVPTKLDSVDTKEMPDDEAMARGELEEVDSIGDAISNEHKEKRMDTLSAGHCHNNQVEEKEIHFSDKDAKEKNESFDVSDVVDKMLEDDINVTDMNNVLLENKIHKLKSDLAEKNLHILGGLHSHNDQVNNGIGDNISVHNETHLKMDAPVKEETLEPDSIVHMETQNSDYVTEYIEPSSWDLLETILIPKWEFVELENIETPKRDFLESIESPRLYFSNNIMMTPKWDSIENLDEGKYDLIENLEERKYDLTEDPVPLPEVTPEMEKTIQKALRSRKKVLIDRHNIRIGSRDIRNLDGLNWLNDEIINFYLQMIVDRGANDHAVKIHAFSTFFYPKLVGGGHTSLRRWTKKVDIFSQDLLLIPVHLGIHWSLAVVNVAKNEVFYYDSMGGDNPDCLNAIVSYLQEEHKVKKGVELDVERFEVKTVEGVPQQMNGSDCGVFLCKFAEYVSRGARLDFAQEDMPAFRKMIVWEILNDQLLQ